MTAHDMRNALAASAQIFIFVALSMKKHFLFIAILFILLGSTTAMAQEKAFGSLTPQCKLITPNAFTPNDDGVNDFFRLSLSGTCEAAVYSLKIYDRWGRQVFESNDATTEWDGTYDGQQLKEGVYLWQASVKWAGDMSAENKIETKKGTLVLIR
jgi:gliding motility-associated-like protein